MNLENVTETKELITELMAEVEKSGCDSKRINDLKEVLESIGNNPGLFVKYEDIYDDAADALMFAGVSADACKCDPLRKHIPSEKSE